MTVIVQQPTDINGNPQPMVYDSDTKKVIVDSNGFIVSGGQKLVNVPSKADYVSTPKTQTLGLQEMVNYVFANNGGKVLIKKGLYDISNAPFQPLGDGVNYAQIVIPEVSTGLTGDSSPTNMISINIEGEGYFASAYGTAAMINGSGTQIYSSANKTTAYSIFGCHTGTITGQGNINPVNIMLDKVAFVTAPSTTLNGIDLRYAFMYNIGSIGIGVHFASSQPTTSEINGGTGAILGIGNYQSAYLYVDNINIFGYTSAMSPSPPLYINNIWVGICQNVFTNIMTTGADYGIFVHNLGIHNVETLVNNPPGTNFIIIIDVVNLGDQGAPYTLTYYSQGSNVYGQAYFGSIENDQYPGLSSGINSAGLFFVSGLVQQMKDTVNAPTSGSLNYFIGTGASQSGWKYIFNFSSYENDTTTDQTVSFPMAFTNTPAIVGNTTGLTITATTSGITITAPDSTTTYSGIVIVEGY